MILLPQPPKLPGLQACATVPSHLLIFDFIPCAFGVLLRKLVPKLTCGSVGTIFSSSRCRVSGLMSTSLIHIELNFLQGER